MLTYICSFVPHSRTVNLTMAVHNIIALQELTLLFGAPIDPPITKQTFSSLEAVFSSDAGILELEQPPQSLRDQYPGRTSIKCAYQCLAPPPLVRGIWGIGAWDFDVSNSQFPPPRGHTHLSNPFVIPIFTLSPLPSLPPTTRSMKAEDLQIIMQHLRYNISYTCKKSFTNTG